MSDEQQPAAAPATEDPPAAATAEESAPADPPEEPTAAAAPQSASDTTKPEPENAEDTSSPAMAEPVAPVEPPVYSLEQSVSYENPAADPRRMRRIIAEDPEWTLATVSLLSDLTMGNIIKNFSQNPILKDIEKKIPPLPAKCQTDILNQLSTDIPIDITANLIESEDYWKRCCKSKWAVCDVSHFGGSWRRMFFERQLEEMVESFTPGTSDISLLKEYLKLVGHYVMRLNIRQLLPPIREPVPEDDTSDAGSDAGDVIENDSHFDFNDIFPQLPKIEEFSVVYGVNKCNLNFEWNLFLFTTTDCLNLSKCVKACTTLKKFSLMRSKVDDEKVRILVKHILDHPSLEELDLSFNKIGDKGARAIGKLINNSKIKKLNLLDNQIGPQGMSAIGHALKKPTTLKDLNLRLNKLGDEGAQALCVAMLENGTVETLNMAANDVTEQTSQFIAQLIVSNSTLQRMDLSCNKLGTDGGKQLQEAMEENTEMTELNLKLTSCGQESEYCISNILHRNLAEKMKEEEESFLSVYKPPVERATTFHKERSMASRRTTAAASRAR